MNFEQALKAFIAGEIGRVPPLIDEEQFVGDALRFTYGKKSSGATKVSPEAQSIFDRPDLKEDGFKFINTGCHGFVIGNGKTVVKIGESFETYGAIPPNTIPHGLAAELRPQGAGKCNGVSYLICEQLNITQPCLLEEIISHFFKARELGVVYDDAKPENYGHDAQGNLKVLDHSHFLPFDKDDFGTAVSDFIAGVGTHQYPFVFSDSRNTYIITKKIYNEFELQPPPSHDPRWLKKINAVLNAVGIDVEKAEYVEGTPVIRIPATHVTYGHPPQEEFLADYISRSLKIAVNQPVPPLEIARGK